MTDRPCFLESSPRLLCERRIMVDPTGKRGQGTVDQVQDDGHLSSGCNGRHSQSGQTQDTPCIVSRSLNYMGVRGANPPGSQKYTYKF